MKRLLTLTTAALALAALPSLAPAQPHAAPATHAADPHTTHVEPGHGTSRTDISTAAGAAELSGGTGHSTGAGGHGAAGHAEPTPFAGTIAQSIAAIIVFLVVFFVLKAKAWGPILKGLTEREGKIRSDLEAAEAARLEAQAKLEEYKRQIAEADAQVRERFAAATKDAEAVGARIKQQAQQEAEEAKARAVKEIDEARVSAIRDVQAQAGSIATLIASKILKRSINEQDQAELVRSSLDEMTRR